jgi:hypothetical protein
VDAPLVVRDEEDEKSASAREAFPVDPPVVRLPTTAATAAPAPTTPAPPPPPPPSAADLIDAASDADLAARSAAILALAAAGEKFEEELAKRAPVVDALLLAMLEKRLALEAASASSDAKAREGVSGLALLWRRLRTEAARAAASPAERVVDAALSALDPDPTAGPPTPDEAARRRAAARAVVAAAVAPAVDIFSVAAAADDGGAAATPTPDQQQLPAGVLAAEAATLAGLARRQAAELRVAKDGGDRARRAAGARDALAALLDEIEGMAREMMEGEGG